MNGLTSTIEALRYPRRAAVPLLILLGGVALAWGITNRPLVVAGPVCLGLLLASTLYFRRHLPRLYLSALWVSLVGYAFADKGFAYLGYTPVFIGELLLVGGILTFVFSNGFRIVRHSYLFWLWIIFSLWGLMRTLPFIGTYGLAALRDAVIWGYGAFAFIVAVALIRSGWLRYVPKVYAVIIPWFVVWVPIVVFGGLQRIVPVYPGTTVSMLRIKNGDLLVHLGGIAAFLMVGLYVGNDPRIQRRRRVLEWLVWSMWLAGFVAAGIETRGGMLAVSSSMVVVLALRPSGRWKKVALIGVVLGTIALISNIRVTGPEREISVSQLVENAVSIVSTDVEDRRLAGTRAWRLEWWEKIRDDTIYGPYFWTGKGFGANLGEESGVAVSEETRSPHNGHLTILARTGVPGALLWILLQVSFAAYMLWYYAEAQRFGAIWYGRMFLWLLAYWTAFHVNAAFDVYLEGPQGGIWFWSVFGAGIATAEFWRRHRYQVGVSSRGLVPTDGSRGPMVTAS